ncbi:MAG: folate-binding protein [Pseudomonadota bacterium]
MNDWLQYLTLQGAQLQGDALNSATDFGQAPAISQIRNGFVSPLTELGLIAADGPEAAHFLHSQLSNDVQHLNGSVAQLAGYCTAKGRLLATFLMWRSGETIFLQLPSELQTSIQKRLQMYVMRAKLKLSSADGQFVSLGLGGEAAGAALGNWFPILPAAPYAQVESQSGTLIRLADAFGAARYQWVTTIATAQLVWPQLTALLTPVAEAVWRLGNIHAGIPQVTLLTQEKFVPQMVNFELIGGVNFKKGCYPGQEIVARSQYLGKLKRRTLLASIAVSKLSVQAGDAVFSSNDPDQPCGTIVNAELNLDGGIDCLVEIKLASLAEGSVHLGSANGPSLAFGDLPYALPSDDAGT